MSYLYSKYSVICSYPRFLLSWYITPFFNIGLYITQREKYVNRKLLHSYKTGIAAIVVYSVEDKHHRLTAGGMDVPVGMKNPTAGCYDIMFD